MSQITKIQWSDSTVNPIMGCGGCELFPSPKKVTDTINAAVTAAAGVTINSHALFKALINKHYQKLKNPGNEIKNAVTTTHISQLQEEFVAGLLREHGKTAADAADHAIKKSITCYAAKQHINKGYSILGNTKADGTPRGVNKGYAPTFEQLTPFEGRAMAAAKWPDLLGRSNPVTPWKEGLARMIFVSDMGDALSAQGHFKFLKSDLMPAIESEEGKRHLWLWLSKRPDKMAKFLGKEGKFPSNVCAMTTLTGADKDSLQRLADLKQVAASMRGLSIEPLWERIPAEKLDLKGIDWVIVGGESGSGDATRPFALEWAEEILEHCRKNKVACFIKQIGRKPTLRGEPYKLAVKRTVMPSGRYTDLVCDPHGGDWSEWPEHLRVREFPKKFHAYRAKEATASKNPRPIPPGGKVKPEELPAITSADKTDFKKLDSIVRKGIGAFVECGKALLEIHNRNLWRVAGHKTWAEYCRNVAGMSKSYVQRIMDASDITLALEKSLPFGNDTEVLLPICEAQARPLKKLEDTEKRAEAWLAATRKAGGQPTQVEVTEAVFEILGTTDKKQTPASRSIKRASIVSELLQVAREQSSWEDVERLATELNAMEEGK